MADEKKYVEIRFRLPIADFEEYVIEANEITKTLSYDVSPTSRIRADAIKQAEIKRENRQPKPVSVMDVFEGL
ncbi:MULTISPECIES: hypothetical protein [Peribacillus]|uniref:hypothetical protein n=1 Tax=Peribacillus TaxID=2675229 RepID=UPI001D1A9A9B|nr:MULTISPECIES: hypothetical protein [Peribacillus]MED3831930.1 hypothetical protein [Peribacillus frigoritolerans]MED3845708.1 hypothetical protein [Peribacillus frigoritolerans]CAH0208225.1 hypothetical protein SRABI84_02072 [Peribacillus simplex]